MGCTWSGRSGRSGRSRLDVELKEIADTWKRSLYLESGEKAVPGKWETAVPGE